ncbi:MAG: roadblock/LC7 domain-containing protein [Nocardiopsaceae bacterium]|nr:roadblock/LC7 domain-containing protein [Nocardiopsaceae bacterium]
MIDEVTWVKGVRHVLVATSDGLVTARSEGTSEDVADRVAAACAGLHSLGRSIGREFGTSGRGVQQVMVGFDGGYLFVRRAGDGSHLAVITEQVVDPALVGQQMQAQVVKIGQRNLSAPPRPSNHTSIHRTTT